MTKYRGRTWSKPSSVPGAGSARPRLALLELAGLSTLVLSGGRNLKMGHASSDMSLWAAADGTGASGSWRQYSVSAAHNALAPKGMVRINQAINESSTHRQLTGYSSLIRVAGDTVVLLYDVSNPAAKACHKPLGSDVCSEMYSMRVGLKADDADCRRGGGATPSAGHGDPGP